jgi:hypothetical protein
MADLEARPVGTPVQLTDVPDATVTMTGEDRMTVEFRINDLVRRLVPGAELAAHCGGCNGCSGCSM